MNKVILMGRLVKDPEVRYSQGATPVAIARYTLAVNRVFKREGDPDADFINIVAIGKRGEFAEKYFTKGQMVGVVGRLQVRTYDDPDGKRQWFTEVLVEEQHFTGGRNENQPTQHNQGNTEPSGFYPINESLDEDDLPF